MHDDRLQPLFDAIRAAVADAYKRGREEVLASMFKTLEVETEPGGIQFMPNSGPNAVPNGKAKPEREQITRVPAGTIGPFVDRVLAAKPGLNLREIKAQARNAFERQISIAGISNHLNRRPLRYRCEKRRWFMIADAAARQAEIADAVRDLTTS